MGVITGMNIEKILQTLLKILRLIISTILIPEHYATT